jgi:hypothetical protein
MNYSSLEHTFYPKSVSKKTGGAALGAMMGFTVAVSIAKASDWKILLVGIPLFLIFFCGISYQLAKEIRALKRRQSSCATEER